MNRKNGLLPCISASAYGQRDAHIDPLLLRADDLNHPLGRTSTTAFARYQMLPSLLNADDVDLAGAAQGPSAENDSSQSRLTSLCAHSCIVIFEDALDDSDPFIGRTELRCPARRRVDLSQLGGGC